LIPTGFQFLCVQPEGRTDVYGAGLQPKPHDDFSGSDRITFTTNDVVTDNSVNVWRTRTYIWNTGSDASNLVSTVEVSVDGLRAWNITFNNGAGVTNFSQNGVCRRRLPLHDQRGAGRLIQPQHVPEWQADYGHGQGFDRQSDWAGQPRV